MDTFKQEIRFAQARDGVRIAYAVAGRGYPMVRATHWLTNIEFDWQSPTIGAILAGYSRRCRLYRYNPRGYGLSAGEGSELSLDSFVADLEAVVDAAGLKRFALNGSSGGAPIAIAYAAKHPDRVSHLILVGAFARGVLRRNPTPQQVERFYATAKLVELGWGEENPGIRQLFTSEFFPNATLEQMRAFNELQRQSASPRQAAQMLRVNADLDVVNLLDQIRAPTIVINCRGDVRVPIEEGRLIASRIENARFIPLDSDNHVPLPSESAFEQMFDEIAAFLGNTSEQAGKQALVTALTARERQILELIARGRDNAQIAAEFGLSDKTVRNHITSIFDKLDVANRAQAIVLAREAGLGS